MAPDDVPKLTGLVPKDDPTLVKLPKSVQIFCVGGAVRDALLGEASQDRDFVVVGASIDQMLAAGFTPVGQDFPVFLHPKSHEEYALARTERKSGQGYKGFVFSADPNVRLEDDLFRRDLTINAIAADHEGLLIDPHHGVQDLRLKMLRHIGPAFSEDPVRLLRLARFAARWPDFSVASETLVLARQIVADGETNALVSERVWQEISKGLMESKPSKMIDLLITTQALASVTGCRSSVSQQSLESIDQAAKEAMPLTVRYALLNEVLHQESSLKAPNSCIDLARIYAEILANLSTLRAEIQPTDAASRNDHIRSLIQWFSRIDLWRKKERFQELLACLRLRQHLTTSEIERLHGFGECLTAQAAQQRISQAAQQAQLKGQRIAEAVDNARVEILAGHLS